MRRAAVSICSNIAEGSFRITTQERKRFFEIARSSLVELDTQIEIAHELMIISKDRFDEISKKTNSVFAQLTRLIART